MGLFDFAKRRRERESATSGLSAGLDPSQRIQSGGDAGQPPPASAFGVDPSAQLGQAQGVDWAKLAQIGPMIQQAIQSGNVQISQGEPQSIDLRGSDVGDQLKEIMRQHGIDPEAGTAPGFDASQMPAMQQQIMDALSQAGVNLGAAQMGGGAQPAGDEGAVGFDAGRLQRSVRELEDRDSGGGGAD
jgi:hypothetical protein